MLILTSCSPTQWLTNVVKNVELYVPIRRCIHPRIRDQTIRHAAEHSMHALLHRKDRSSGNFFPGYCNNLRQNFDSFKCGGFHNMWKRECFHPRVRIMDSIAYHLIPIDPDGPPSVIQIWSALKQCQRFTCSHVCLEPERHMFDSGLGKTQ